MSTMTRRSLVAATPAAVVTAALSSSAVVSGMDAELLALRSLWHSTWAAFDATFPPLEAAEQVFWEKRPSLPDPKTFDGSSEEYKIAHRTITAEIERLEIETGVKAAEDAQGLACEANWQAAQQILSIPARTIEGVRFKNEVLQNLEGVDLREFKAGLLSDLLAIVGVHNA